jgi:hypothetical protein
MVGDAKESRPVILRIVDSEKESNWERGRKRERQSLILLIVLKGRESAKKGDQCGGEDGQGGDGSGPSFFVRRVCNRWSDKKRVPCGEMKRWRERDR